MADPEGHPTARLSPAAPARRRAAASWRHQAQNRIVGLALMRYDVEVVRVDAPDIGSLRLCVLTPRMTLAQSVIKRRPPHNDRCRDA